MRRKIFLYGFITSLVAVLVVGIISFFIVRTSFLDEARSSASSIANIVINDIHSAKDYDYEVRAQQLGKNQSGIPYRITLIKKDGTVVGDSSAEISDMDNHAGRPEVVQALAERRGSAMRYSDTLKTQMLYVARHDMLSGVTVRVALPLTELTTSGRNLLVGVSSAVLIGGVLSLLVSFLFARSLSRPIHRLAENVRAFAKGELTEQTVPKTHTEIDTLANDFSAMAASVQQLVGQLRHKNVEFKSVLSSMEDGLIAVDNAGKVLYLNPVAQRIFNTDDVFYQRDLKLTSMVHQTPLIDAVNACTKQTKTMRVDIKLGVKDPLDYKVTVAPMIERGKQTGAIVLFTDVTHLLELEKMRTDFVANVSHELRTPLTSIKGYAEALKDGAVEDSENTKRFLDIIEIEADRLNGLINDLMELSKIENKSQDIKVGQHHIAEVLDETIEIFHLKAKNKQVEIIKKADPDVKILANRDRIKQLLLNLIDNGIKYNKQAGKLWVDVKTKDKCLIVTVKDTGEGIDAKDMPRLFERFYRVEKSRSRELGGTGLGLSIVKHIAELYEGKVSVSSQKGVGTEFVVTLPIVI